MLTTITGARHWAKEPACKRVNISWGQLHRDNSFGTHEFIGLCRLIGAEPYLAGMSAPGRPRNAVTGSNIAIIPAAASSATSAQQWFPRSIPREVLGVGNEMGLRRQLCRPDYYGGLYRQFAGYLHEREAPSHSYRLGPLGRRHPLDAGGLLDTTSPIMPDGLSMHYTSGGADEPTKFATAAMGTVQSFRHVEMQLSISASVLDGLPGGLAGWAHPG